MTDTLFARLRRKLEAHFVTRPGPEDGQVTEGLPKRPVMAGVDAATETAHVGASITYDESEVATRGTPFRLASRRPDFVRLMSDKQHTDE